ncbi:hypothetical protein B0H63DRAFT_183581 [Podospora didyma]|uniref:Uncharacterized protein n=1 Tax=Podospora didyma TaxID=330526 RepID=A0AAE0TZR9_9PEZI|nr:hypothetical protein B0H63DRAFT_183581 [Podospora didyma]
MELQILEPRPQASPSRLPPAGRRKPTAAARRLSRRPTSTTLASRCSISTNPFPPPIAPNKSRRAAIRRHWDRILDWFEVVLLLAGLALFFTALIPSQGRNRFLEGQEGGDAIGLLTFAMPLAVLTFLSMGMQECVNLDEIDPLAAKTGERRSRMTRPQLRFVLGLRSVVFVYAVICPVLLIFAPGGLTSKSPHYRHYTAEAVALALAALIAVLAAFLIADAIERLRAWKGSD